MEAQTQDQANAQPTSLKIDMSVIMLLGRKLYTQNQYIVFVRETLQNSIDADATRIDITTNALTDPEGKEILKIQVIDNGDGISDFQKYFLTLGGSTKRTENNNMVGGFGIAKLAIMSMRNWSITSLDGTITRDILTEGLPIDKARSDKGCSIIAESDDFKWYYNEEIKDFLKLLNCRAQIFYNSELIKPLNLENVTIENIPDGILKIVDGKLERSDNQVIVRLNGIPQFFKSVYMENEKNNYIYDIQTNEDPYATNYPMNASREGLNEKTAEYSLLQTITNGLTRMSQEKTKAEKEIKANVRQISTNQVLAGNRTKKDLKTYAWHIKTYTRYLKQIAELMDDNTNYLYGLTDDPQVAGMYASDKYAFFINPDHIQAMDKGNVLEIAMHEYAHTRHPNHYHEYSTFYGMIVQKVLNGIFDKTFRQ